MKPKARCPYCEGGFAVDLATNIVMYNRKTIQLYPKITELVSLLWQAFPDPVLNQTLLYRIYGVGGGPDGGYGSLSVLMSHCRDKLNRIGVDVQPCKLEGRLARRLHFTDSSYLSIWDWSRIAAEGGKARRIVVTRIR